MRIQEKPFGVKQSPLLSEHLSHFVCRNLLHGKLATVFRPLPNGTPPVVGVR
jgi:hypothetical protein